MRAHLVERRLVGPCDFLAKGAAFHAAIDVLRRGKLLERKHEELGHEIETTRETPDLEEAILPQSSDILKAIRETATY